MLSEDSQRHIIYFCMGVILVFAAIAGMQPIWEFDLWWHLKVGEWIVQHTEFPTTDIFSSFHPEREWKTFNWLFEVIVYEIQSTFGLFGLRVFAAALLVSGLILWLIYFFRQTKNNLTSLALLVFLLMIYVDRIQIRPHLTNFIFEALILLFFQSGGLLQSWKSRTLFFLTAVLWTNLHTPCSAIGMCAVWFGCFYKVALAAHLGQSQKKVWKDMLWPAGLYAVAICCNPYGPHLLWAGVNNITPVFSMIGEWKPPLSLLQTMVDSHDFIYAVTPSLVFLSSVLVLYRNRKKLGEMNQNHWITAGGVPIAFLIVSQISLRFVYLSIPMIAWLLSFSDLRIKKTKYFLTSATIVCFIILYAHQINDLGGARATIRNLQRDISPDPHPNIANTLINEAKLSGTAYSAERWGGYLMWFSPSLTGVFSDTRNNLSKDAFELQHQIYMHIGVDYEKLGDELSRTRDDFAVLPRGAFPFSHWPTDRWIRVAHDELFEVFMRTDSPNLKILQQWLGVQSEENLIDIEKAATKHFGERYYVSKLERIAELQSDKTENAVHKLGLIEKIAGHDPKALEIFANHLNAYPNCLFAILEVADILHLQGRYTQAQKFLSPMNSFDDPPLPLKIMWDHIETHIQN